jgi:hypothetical protein
MDIIAGALRHQHRAGTSGNRFGFVIMEAVMGRFYFHLRQGDQLLADDEGVDLPDFATAQREALDAAWELFAEAIQSDKTMVPGAFVIADEAGLALDIIPLGAVPPERSLSVAVARPASGRPIRRTKTLRQ